MVFRTNEIIFRTNEIIFRTKEIIFRTKEIIFRTNEIIFRTNEILFRTNEIKKITTFNVPLWAPYDPPTPFRIFLGFLDFFQLDKTPKYHLSNMLKIYCDINQQYI